MVAFDVKQRTREIGIRLALGATRREVLRLVLGEGVVVVVAGLAAGLVLTLAGARVLGSFLYGLTPTDPMTYAGVSLFLVAVAALAAYLPARRALRVDPLVAIRSE